MGHRMMILLFPALTLGHGDHPQINGYSLCSLPLQFLLSPLDFVTLRHLPLDSYPQIYTDISALSFG